MKKNNPTIMLLWHANPNPFAPPILSENQITGVLEEFENQTFIYGGSKFTIPRGDFDLEALLRLKNIQKPDFLFICLDSTTPYFARNIDQVCKSTFLCLGDSHHLPNPISRLISYASLENFQAHIFTNNVRHSHWFNYKCNAEQYFEPGLFALNLGKYNSAEKYKIDINSPPVFYGQIGDFHPRRKRIVPSLIKNNLVKHIYGSEEKISTELQQGLACLNLTLNSDLNSRVFEVAQTGCLQIVDQLSVHNGHGLVLIPGHNCLTFKTEDELTNILTNTNYLLKQGRVIGENLRNEYNTFWGINCIKERLYKTISTNTIKFNPLLVTRKKINSNSTFESRLSIYENLLELHRCHETINLLLTGPESAVFLNDAVDLPRIIFSTQEELLSNLIHPKILIRTYDQSSAEIFHVV
jgi:hypothetical protein